MNEERAKEIIESLLKVRADIMPDVPLVAGVVGVVVAALLAGTFDGLCDHLDLWAVKERGRLVNQEKEVVH